MRWFKAGLFAGPVALFSIALLTAGCGGGGSGEDENYKPPKRRPSGPGPAAAETKRTPVVAQNNQYSEIKGKVAFDGSPPDLDALTASFTAGMTNDGAYCKTGRKADGTTFAVHPLETQQQDYRIGKNSNLGNVFVWIEPPKGSYFQIPEKQLEKFKNTTVTVSQPHCVFLPHCSVVFPKYYKDGGLLPSGQELEVENDAFVAHNAKFTGAENNRNVGLGARTTANVDKKRFALEPEDNPITVSCNVHTWMRSYVLARDHPYAAVSSVGAKKLDAKDHKQKVYEDLNDEKFGTFRIEGVPVGAKVRLKAWHEKIGYITPRDGKEITITAGPMDVSEHVKARMK
jgi:hypothetical protein